MITQKKLVEIVSTSLKVKRNKIKKNTKSEDLEEWDSLGQLNILSKLDDVLNGKTVKIKKLAECYSVNSIQKILIKNKLMK